MKKVFTSAFILAILITKAEAQIGLSYSVKVLPQLSFLQSKYNSSTDARATLKAGFGIGVAYNFTNYFGIGTDVLYSLQGQHYTIAGKKYNQKNDYIKVPVFFIYNSNTSKPVSFIAKIGEQISFITNSKFDEIDGNKTNGDVKYHKQAAIFGGMASVGTQYRLKDHLYLTTALRFDYDFSNVEDAALSGNNNVNANSYITAGVEAGLRFIL